jgi:hypothetical protein
MQHTPEELDLNKTRKETLCREAETLQESTQWRETAERLKAMQQEWKEIGPVPFEESAILNQRFRAACDVFFENRTRNFQNQELERIDNLYRKTELCERAEALHAMEDLQVALDTVQEIFQEWKSIGPVPREKSEPLWERFRAAQDTLYHRRRLLNETLDKSREENLRLKTALCEEAETFAMRDDFDMATPLIIDLQERWKATGPVPREVSDALWDRFRSACDTFFQRKNAHYGELDELRLQNLKVREQICKEALKLRESIEWNETTDKIKQLQADWKAAWPVPKEDSDKLWETFREACDTFFERKRIHYEEKRKTWLKSQAVWRANMEKLIERKEEEITRLEAAIGYEQSNMEEWQIRLDKLPPELKSIDLKPEIEEKIDRARQEIERKEAMIRQLHGEISEIQQKLAKE